MRMYSIRERDEIGAVARIHLCCTAELKRTMTAVVLWRDITHLFDTNGDVRTLKEEFEKAILE